ncbi:MAG TPA: AMP-binding protein [Rhodospirillales bacterium]|nr:AMP-binding protein [Rhodospirillales bacterium]
MKTLYPKVARRLADGGGLETIVVCSMTGILPFSENTLFAVLKRREIAAVPDDEQHVPYDRLIDNDGIFEASEIDPPRDVAVLQYTGGTTGLPKAARLTHANLYANAPQVEMWAQGAKPGGEKILGVLPLFHAFGMTAVMNVGLRLGAELILLPRFKTAEVLTAIDRERPTIFIGVPTMYSALNAAHGLGEQDLSSLVYCISDGAPLPAKVRLVFEEMTGCAMVEGYGLSETAPVCTVNPFTGTNKAAKLRAFLKDKLAPFEISRRVEFRDMLPKTLIGKISKKELIGGEPAEPPGGPDEATETEP